MKYDVIIIGAGCAGLMAMRELLTAGYHVCLLEASPSAGGRIATIKEKGFDSPVETGAEFIHGKLPITRKLLRKANIPYLPIEGKMISVLNGTWNKREEHEKHWDELMRKLEGQKTDITRSARHSRSGIAKRTGSSEEDKKTEMICYWWISLPGRSEDL